MLSSNKFFYYLCTLYILLLAMIFLGSLTRLTGSGLSMTNWSFWQDIIPPITKYSWQTLFNLYKKSPEFIQINFWMDIEDFKNIFWLEYLHRLLGKIIGLFLLGITYVFWKNKKKYKKLLPYILALWILGISQGIAGWIMVKSGLFATPYVNHLKLTLHLILAMLSILVTLRIINFSLPQNNLPSLPRYYWLFFIAVVINIIWGGFMAGTKAGLLYSTFPLMNNQWIPEEIFSLTFNLSQLWNNPILIHVIHRYIAYIIIILGIMLSFHIYKTWPQPHNQHGTILSILLFSQFILGIITVRYNIPIVSASLHSICAMILISHTLWIFLEQKSKYKTKSKILS